MSDISQHRGRVGRSVKAFAVHGPDSHGAANAVRWVMGEETQG